MIGGIDFAARACAALNGLVWGPVLPALLLGTGIFLSVRTGWVQLRRFGTALRHAAGSLRPGRDGESGKNLSPFQAAATALAGTVGTGNIAGVAGAVLLGGPGAVFWMWVSAFFGMCTKYAEIALAVKYREERDGVRRGGPMFYIEKGLGGEFRPLAVSFAVFGGLASFGIGNLTQGSEIAAALEGLLGLRPAVSGALLAAIVGAVLLGGAKRVGKITEVLVPLMAGVYLLLGLAILLFRAGELPRFFALVFSGAFDLRAAGGGFLGSAMARAMRQGVARGVFSNEAGLGSAPIAHGASAGEAPCREALWGVFEVFVDTMVICTVTAFAVVVSGVWEVRPDAFSSNGEAAMAAFEALLPGRAGVPALRICLVFFALSTMFSWSYYGECCWAYVCRGTSLYRVLFILTAWAGSVGRGTLMWNLSDALNGLMALPNLAALLLLSGDAAKIAREY